MRILIALALSVLASLTTANAASIRLKDVVVFDGVRGNDLVGYGLVVGLNGTGDSLREALKIADPNWRPLIPEWDHVSQQIIGQALPSVITGKTPAKTALDSVVGPAEDVVRKAGLLT